MRRAPLDVRDRVCGGAIPAMAGAPGARPPRAEVRPGISAAECPEAPRSGGAVYPAMRLRAGVDPSRWWALRRWVRERRTVKGWKSQGAEVYPPGTAPRGTVWLRRRRGRQSKRRRVPQVCRRAEARIFPAWFRHRAIERWRRQAGRIGAAPSGVRCVPPRVPSWGSLRNRGGFVTAQVPPKVPVYPAVYPQGCIPVKRNPESAARCRAVSPRGAGCAVLYPRAPVYRRSARRQGRSMGW